MGMFAVFIGTFNVIAPGSISMEDNGPTIHTSTATVLCFISATDTRLGSFQR